MAGMTKAQIVELARRWRYNFDSGKKANLLSLRAEIEHVKLNDQKVTVKYAEAVYDLLMNGRPHMLAADVAAYLTDVSDADVSAALFPQYDKARIQAIADRSPKPQPLTTSTSRPSSPAVDIPLSRPKADFTHLPSGHQALLGAGNVIGNGISIAFIVFVVLIIVVAIGSAFG